MEQKLRDKVAAITGASRGIGREIALAFAKEGAKIVVNYHSNSEAALETKQAIEDIGGNAVSIQADVSNSSQVQNLFHKCKAEFGNLDILVNNASWETANFLWELPEEIWDRTVASTLKSAFLCSKEAAHLMMPQKHGKIINISSIHDYVPRRTASAYCAAKAGLLMLTKVLALELASYNIQVNAVSPGLIDTDRTSDFIRKHSEDISEAIPAGRAGTGKEVAEMVLYLASDLSSYTSGTTIYIDGAYIQNVCRLY